MSSTCLVYFADTVGEVRGETIGEGSAFSELNGLLEVVATEVLDDLGDLDTGNVGLGEVVEIDELLVLLHHF